MRIICFFMAALLLWSAPVAATAQPDDVAVVENYLNNLHTLKARFIQTASDGQQIAGDVYLQRPGRLRVEDDDPVTDFIVADGMFIYYYDGQMKQQSNAPISQSLADFFLRKNIKLSGDITVSGIKRVEGTLQVTLTQTKDPHAGALTLGFTEKPMQLKKWRITDAQGAITEINLYEAQTGMKLDSDLFHYYDPERKKQSFN